MVNFSVSVFEDERRETRTSRADVTDETLAWFRDALGTIGNPPLEANRHEGVGSDMPEIIEIHLCSQETMSDIFGEGEALGLHAVWNPESDPFGDGTDAAKALRCLVVIDRGEIESRLAEEIAADGEDWERHIVQYETAEAITVFHEVAHALLFAANSGWVSPETVERLSGAGMINNDVFDHMTGYGMRPLDAEGKGEVWADDMRHASDLMEAWCERQGRLWCEKVLARSPGSFYRAVGIDPHVLTAVTVPSPSPSS